MKNLLISASERRSLPLCRSYLCVAFEAFTLRAKGESDATAEEVCWAVGILSDGSPEFLGSWREAGLTGTLWQSIADDLNSRGVERLRFVLGAEPEKLKATMAIHYRDAIVLPASGKGVDQATMASVLPGHRRYLEIAHEVAFQLKRGLGQAVARQDNFADPVAAEALLRRSAERYIEANWPEPPVRPWRVPRSIRCSGLETAGR